MPSVRYYPVVVHRGCIIQIALQDECRRRGIVSGFPAGLSDIFNNTLGHYRRQALISEFHRNIDMPG